MKCLSSAGVSLIICFVALFVLSPAVSAHNGEEHTVAEVTAEPHLFVFGRADCSYCEEQRTFLNEQAVPYVYLPIDTDPEALRLYNLVLEKHSLSRVTPLTVVGEKIFLGFNGPRTTGQQIKKELLVVSSIRTIEQHLESAPIQAPDEGAICTGVTCDMGNEGTSVVSLPLVGMVSLGMLPLTSVPLLSLLLGGVGVSGVAVWGYGKRQRLNGSSQKHNLLLWTVGGIVLLVGVLLATNLVWVLW